MGILVEEGRGRYYLHPEARARFYVKFIGLKELSPLLQMCIGFIEDIKKCPSKDKRVKLAIKAQKIMLCLLLGAYDAFVWKAPRCKTIDEMEKVTYALTQFIRPLALLNSVLLKVAWGPQLEKMLKDIEQFLKEKVVEEMESYIKIRGNNAYSSNE